MLISELSTQDQNGSFHKKKSQFKVHESKSIGRIYQSDQHPLGLSHRIPFFSCPKLCGLGDLKDGKKMLSIHFKKK